MIYSINDIAKMCPGKAIINVPYAPVEQLLTDSRSLSRPESTIFFAIKTHEGDGHNYVVALYQQGVRNFVVENEQITADMADANFIVVDNSLTALQHLAAEHRRRFHIPVIAITGSRGKTTVKEWLALALKAQLNVTRSPRSYNSQIGVALSLWEIDEHTDVAIIEAGISTTGEMERLEAMIAPTISIITNVGDEHDEGFASIEEKIAEKAIIARNAQLVVACADNTALVSALTAGSEAGLLTWSHTDRQAQEMATRFGSTIDTDNAMTVITAMQALGADDNEIDDAVRWPCHVDTRINVIEGVNNCTLITDGYTCDLSSLPAAIDFMKRRTTQVSRQTVILPQLVCNEYEKEVQYATLHRMVTERGVDRMIGIGSDYLRFKDLLPGALIFATVGDFTRMMSQGDFENESILVKDDAKHSLYPVIEMIEASRHQTVEEVDLNALAHNFKFFKSHLRSGTKTVAMVKASGYGTGSFEIAKTLQDRGADYLAVAVQDEGVDLRHAGITMPIIVLNPSVVNYRAMFTHHLEPEVYSIEEARELIREGERVHVKDFPVHIKLDTGMHRLGFTKAQLPELIKLLHSQDVIKPVSVFSHLCVADEPEQDAYTMEQLEYFEECTTMLQTEFNHKLLRHILNTTGIVRFPQYQYDMVRIGIGLYGIKTVTDDSEDALQPVAALHSVIISIKEWKAGTTIGYGRRGRLTRDSVIATVTIGYADGFDRHFGNGNTAMWVNGTLCPTVGNVCMDAVMIDVTDAQCAVGDRVEIFGKHVPIEVLSDARGTIPYEILTSVSPRVKRVYFRE